MAISAERFKFLDKETNVGLIDKTAIDGNSIYTSNIADNIININPSINDKTATDIAIAAANDIRKLSELLDKDNTDRLIKDKIDQTLNDMSKMVLPESAKSILDSVSKLENNALRSFLKEAVRAGSHFLCNNLDFLKSFMLGYGLTNNVLAGLLLALLLSWLDRYCKEFTQEEMKKASNREILEMMFPPSGVVVTEDNVFTLFKGYYSDYLKNISAISSPALLTTGQFIDQIRLGNKDLALNNLIDNEITDLQKTNYKTAVDGFIQANPNIATNEINNLLEVSNILGRSIGKPFISKDRKNKSVRYQYTNAKFASYIKNMVNVNIPNNSFLSQTPEEKSLYDKMILLQNISRTDYTIRSTPTEKLDHIDLVPILQQLNITSQETDFLNNININTDSHRLYDIHPTTELFLQTS